ncbi:hypothetical protein DPMN_101358 [Dreissena polymorpha]|uniref:Uncharacterized protein n=1 Tax=Dreissena polymorpha TaxID=45954 RepID=A0A9D4LKZ4_DREPO|nr:hypothetical protein DPMN_101358 [Dreissena polymorpha]
MALRSYHELITFSPRSMSAYKYCDSARSDHLICGFLLSENKVFYIRKFAEKEGGCKAATKAKPRTNSITSE